MPHSSLKNNDRREKREHFEKDKGLKVENTEYAFPKVSERERKNVVDDIIKERGSNKTSNYLLIIGLSLVIVFILLPLLFRSIVDFLVGF